MSRSAVIALLALAALTACSYVDRDLDPYRPPLADAAEADGKTLYARDCAWCHGAQGAGTDRGPSLISGTNGPALTDFVLSTGRMPIDDPQERSLRRAPVYDPEEIARIVRHVDGFGAPGPAIPDVDPREQPSPEGLELYQEHCAACHAPTGVGAAITSGRGRADFPSSIIAPSLFESTRVQIAEAVRTGPGTMPVFGTGTLSDAQVDEVVDYVDYLQDPNDRGGSPIGRVGPVAEGAIGWVFGMLALLLFARWMGTKAGEE